MPGPNSKQKHLTVSIGHYNKIKKLCKLTRHNQKTQLEIIIDKYLDDQDKKAS